jgi:Sulfotransferase family
MVVLIRHPIAVAGATRQFGRARRTWKRMSYTSLIEHWLRCHELLMEDAPQIEHLLVMRYEEFVFDPDRRLSDVFRFAGVDPLPSGLEVRGGINDGYFRRWALARRGPGTGTDIAAAVEALEDRVSRFGYSLKQPVLLTPLERVG